MIKINVFADFGRHVEEIFLPEVSQEVLDNWNNPIFNLSNEEIGKHFQWKRDMEHLNICPGCSRCDEINEYYKQKEL